MTGGIGDFSAPRLHPPRVFLEIHADSAHENAASLRQSASRYSDLGVRPCDFD
jgi:hypothetical protein